MPCGICKQPGHNRKTCHYELDLDHDEFVQRINDELDKEDEEDGCLDKSKSKSKSKKKKKSGEREREEEKEEEEKKEKEKKEKEEEECVICYDSMVIGGRGTVVTKCGHVYCVTCFGKLIQRNNKCGYCREELCPPMEKPKLNNKQRDFLVANILHTEHMNAVLYSDFEIQVTSALRKTVESEETRITCLNILKQVNIDCGMWIASLLVFDEIAYVYENNLHDRVPEIQRYN